MQDRLVAGGIAGFSGALGQEVICLGIKLIGLTDKSFCDLTRNLVMSPSTQDSLGFILGLSSHLALGAFLGIIFSYIILFSSSKYLYFKGIFYGALIWLVLLSLVSLFDLTGFKVFPAQTSLIILLGSVIYGGTTAFFLGIFIKRKVLL